MKKEFGNKLNIVIFLLPALLLFCGVLIAPIGASAYYSLFNWKGPGAEKVFIGLGNYVELFTSDRLGFVKALVNSMLLAVLSVGLQLPLALALALALGKKIKGERLFLSVYFMPVLISTVVIGQLWVKIYDPAHGILNVLLRSIGLDNLAQIWLGDTKTALACIGVVIGWSCIGYHVVLYMSALDSISPEIYESATLDGASGWQQVCHITLPLMKNILGITFVLMMSGVLGVSFVYSKVMTNGGPNGSTRVLLHYIYQQGLERGNVGYASAVTVITMAIAIFLAVLSRILTKRSEA